MEGDLPEEPSVLGAGSYGGNAAMPSENYPTPYAEKMAMQTLQGGYDRHRPRLQRYKDARKSLEAKLAEVNKAIQLLEANPQMNELMDAIEKVGI